MTVSDWIACATFAVVLIGLGTRAVALLTTMKHDIRKAIVFAKMEARENDREHDEFRKLFDEHGKTLGFHGEQIAVLKSKSGMHSSIYEKNSEA